ncbi:hypothetical protein ACQEVF_52755 [Nonomuraea polychroma]
MTVLRPRRSPLLVAPVAGVTDSVVALRIYSGGGLRSSCSAAPTSGP